MDTHEIGETAGRVWQHLAKAGPTFFKDVPKAVGVGNEMSLMAIGWLAREHKVLFETKGKETRVLPTEAELKSLGSKKEST